jgi:hypothetical protein
MKGYIDMIITNNIMSSMTNSNSNSNDKYGMKMLLNMILMSSIDDIKRIVFEYIVIMRSKLYDIFKYIVNLCKRYKNKNKIEYAPTLLDLSELEYVEGENIIIEISPTMQFMESLYNYMVTNPDICTFTKSNKFQMVIDNIEDKKVVETCSNIRFNYKDHNIDIQDNITLELAIKKNGHKIIKADTNLNLNLKSEITSLSELIYDEKAKNAFQCIYNRIKNQGNNYVSNDNNNGQITDYHSCLVNRRKCTLDDVEPGIAKTIYITHKNTYKNIPDQIFYNEILIMHDLYIYFINSGLGLIQNKKGGDDYVVTKIFGITIEYHSSFYKSRNRIQVTQMEIQSLFPYMESVIKTKTISDKTDVINFTISSKSLNQSQLYDSFNDFINTFNIISHNKTNKIAMNHLKLNKNEVISESPNPEYNEYLEKKEVLVSKDNETNTLLLSEFMKEKIPNKVIINKSIKKEIVCDIINEIHKDLTTLYLRQNDLFKLTNCLEIFNDDDKKKLMETLGLPHKLGIMLHGLPGTGKTSTIHAVATYLQKDLYYVNLNELETNDELQMMFDYVNKNCINGGIIVFEDIDAMTSIVHKRTDIKNKKDLNFVELMSSKSNKLTLEYFLNVLQGSLTQDGTMFMVTTNHLEMIDDAFYRDGRFDINIEMKMCDHYQMNMIYNNFYKRNIPEDILINIKEDKWTPANIIFHIKNYMFGEFTDEQILEKFIEK